MTQERPARWRLTPLWRAVIKTGFVIFPFCWNPLMGEFTRVNGHGKTFAVALGDIAPPPTTNFAITVISALVGHAVVEYLRKHI